MINSQPSPGKPLLTVDDTSNIGSLYFLNAPHCGMGSPHGVHSDLSENGVCHKTGRCVMLAMMS